MQATITEYILYTAIMPSTSEHSNVKKEIVNNYEEFTAYVEKLQGKHADTFFFFTGKRKENGLSWCMYCALAEPVINAYLTELKRKVVFVRVDVGDITTWKDKDCPFRTDRRTKLMMIPTIVKWDGVKRLEGSQCSKRDLLQMLFEVEEE